MSDKIIVWAVRSSFEERNKREPYSLWMVKPTQNKQGCWRTQSGSILRMGAAAYEALIGPLLEPDVPTKLHATFSLACDAD